MCENLCRICARNVQEKDAIKLFDNQNKHILLQLKELTGLRLKSSLGFPKLMCCDCKRDLISAYKFRDDFLKVQASFKLKNSKGNKKQNCNGLVEATEFVQVCVVKEEMDITIDNHEEFYEADEEKEMNISPQDLIKKPSITFVKESENEVNALELKPSEENTLEDTKICVEEVICYKTDDDFDTTTPLSDGAFYVHDSDEDYNPQKITVSKKSKINRKSKKLDGQPTEKINLKSKKLDGQPTEKINRKSKKLDGQPTEKINRKSKKLDGQPTEIGKIDIKREITKSKKKRKDADGLPNIFICDQCGNHFTCRHHFKLHLRRHTGDKRCACELCPDKFFTSSELRRHMRRHTGERPFACKYCDRRFTDYSTRIKHERTHTNERPFMCSQCGKSFTTSYILKNHMLTHTGERHFKCDVCNRSFTRRTHLVVHFRSLMHKQAVEKDKRPTSHEEMPPPQCLMSQSTHIPTFIV